MVINPLIYNNADISKATAVTVTSGHGSTLQMSNYSENVVTIDTSSRTKAINITGNAKNNKIFGVSGEDIFEYSGGNGSDVFVYEGGND